MDNGNLANNVTLFSFWGTNSEITQDSLDSETANHELTFTYIIITNNRNIQKSKINTLTQI